MIKRTLRLTLVFASQITACASTQIQESDLIHEENVYHSSNAPIQNIDIPHDENATDNEEENLSKEMRNTPSPPSPAPLDLNNDDSEPSQTQIQILPASTPISPNDFYANSIQSLQLADKSILLAADDVSGHAQAILLKPDGTILPFTVSKHAQIACLSNLSNGFAVAVLKRNSDSGKSSIFVYTYDENGALNSNETWNVTTRGFTPDAGSQCAIVNRRQIFAVGTRPRGDTPPDHGLFLIESRGLTFFSQTEKHAPNIDALIPNSRALRLRVREVDRFDNSNKRLTRIYEIQKDALIKIDEAPFLPHQISDSFIHIDENACLLTQNHATICPEIGFKPETLVSIPEICDAPNDICLQILGKKQTAIARFYTQTQAWKVQILPQNAQLIPNSQWTQNDFVAFLFSDPQRKLGKFYRAAIPCNALSSTSHADSCPPNDLSAFHAK